MTEKSKKIPTTNLDKNVKEYSMLIDGKWVSAVSGNTFNTSNPYTSQVIGSVPEAGTEDVDRAVKAARSALESGPWSTMSARDRGKLIRRLGDLLAQNADRFGQLESADNGKLLAEMNAQAHVLPEWFYYFAGAADKMQGATIPSDRPNFFIYTRPEPVGVVGAITPWNSPIVLLGFKLAPALAAGCTFVVKPSEHTPLSTLEFGKLVQEAGFPDGVFNVVTGAGETGSALAEHPGLDKLSFTGSGETGRKVALQGAERFIPVTLELGGKSPNIVFEDADLEAAANGIMAGIFAASGQTCMAGSRLVVQKSIANKLVSALAKRANRIILGDPMEPTTQMGPMATKPQFEKVKGILERARAQGVTFACGGGPAEGMGGYFIAPTIAVGVSPEMEIAKEEIFGPVLSVLTFEDEEDAIKIANDTAYGLAAGVWTSSVQRGHRVAHKIKAGTVWINAYRVVSPSVPFGGFKQSGLGRENGIDAIKEYTQNKSVWVETEGATQDPFNIS
jgi:aldehyde dehydrogenase (NAD+)